METTDVLSTIRRRIREHPPLVALGVETSKTGANLLLPLPALDSRVCLTLQESHGELTLIATGNDDEMQRLLRNSLVGLSELRSDSDEHHVLETFQGNTPPRRVLNSIAGWAQRIQELVTTALSVSKGIGELPQSSVLAYWWDSRANFGDAAGPWLIRAMTGNDVVNTRFTKAKGRAVGSIGSLFQMLNRGRLDMWGSGILYPPSEGQIRKLKRLKGISIHAVRGPKTRAVLEEKLGWEVPEVYGDPALLFPRYLTPAAPHDKGRIAFVPHKHHWKYFKKGLPSQVTKLSVADDVETVVTSIATAGVCISTSLHGIIFAQAYGVPWVWLNVQDDELKGGEFKFEDFFATLDGASVARHEVAVNQLQALDLEEVATKAALPELRIDLNALENAFPLERSNHLAPTDPARFRWDLVAGEERLVALSRVAYRKQRRVRRAVIARAKGSDLAR